MTKTYDILIIEDNEQNRYLTKFLLESYGHTVRTAVSGKEGVLEAESKCPDLVLLDIQLPEMNGYEVLQCFRSNPAIQHVPIIVVTSYAMPGDREQSLAAGANGYIEKPINPDTFMTQIEEYLTIK